LSLEEARGRAPIVSREKFNYGYRVITVARPVQPVRSARLSPVCSRDPFACIFLIAPIAIFSLSSRGFLDRVRKRHGDAILTYQSVLRRAIGIISNLSLFVNKFAFSHD